MTIVIFESLLGLPWLWGKGLIQIHFRLYTYSVAIVLRCRISMHGYLHVYALKLVVPFFLTCTWLGLDV